MENPGSGAFVESEVEYFSEEDQRGPRGPLTDGVEVPVTATTHGLEMTTGSEMLPAVDCWEIF